MSKTVWPTALQLDAVLTSAGITIPAWTTAADIVGQAIAEWESLTGCAPWLADGSDIVYGTFNGTPYLMLSQLMVSVTSIDWDDCILDPDQWALDGPGPYFVVILAEPMRSKPQAITVTGVPGYSTAIPDDVWNAVLGRMVEIAKDAVGLAQGNMGASVTGNVKSVKQGTVAIEYSTPPANAFGYGKMLELASRYAVSGV